MNAKFEATGGDAVYSAIDLAGDGFVRSGAEQTLFTERPRPAFGMPIFNTQFDPPCPNGPDTPFEEPGNLFVRSRSQDGFIDRAPRLAQRIEWGKALAFAPGNHCGMSALNPAGQVAIGYC